jgi:hypothetical protein
MKLFDANVAWARSACARVESEQLAVRQADVERVLSEATEQRQLAVKNVQADCLKTFEAQHAKDVRSARRVFVSQGLALSHFAW